MIIAAETVYQALFEYICQINAPQANGQPSLTPLRTMSRRWRMWDVIGDDAMPAFFQLQPPNTFRLSQSKHFGQTRYVLHADLYFYFAVDVNDEETPISPKLNAYFQAIDQLLQPNVQSPGGSRQQIGLGPKVEHVWIDNADIIMDEGIVVPPAILKVPVSILTG